MKKILFLLLPFFLYGFELDFSKEFTKDLIPNILTADISVIIEDQKEKDVLSRLEVFNKEIKAYNKVEKQLGTFNVRPMYQTSNNTPKIYGYRGELNYKIETNDALFMGEFVSMITSMKENRDTSVSLHNLSWRVKDDSYNVIIDLLRLESINWIENYAKVLSDDLHKTCSVKNINLSNNIMHTYREQITSLKLNSSLKKENVPVPEVSRQKISLITNYKLECK
jgi:predicted secreted protein